jgi:hypothetical protein
VREIRWLAALCVGLSAATYGWILRIGFHRDDLVHLYEAANLPLPAFVAHGVGGHALALFNLVFLAHYELFGLHPGCWMAAMLLAHLVNVLLCFRVGRALSQNAPAAALAALLFGVCNAAAGTLYWFSVFGQVMATTLALTALAAILIATQRQPARYALIGIAVVAVTGATLCFGTGFAFALLFPLTAWLIAPAVIADERARLPVVLTPLLAALLYAANLWFTELSVTATHPPGAMRNAILPLVLSGWSNKALAIVQLMSRGAGDLLFGLFGSPPLWVGAAVALATVAHMARLPVAQSRRALGLIVAATAVYGAIAATRGTLAADEYPLTRYQYQATALLALAIPALAGKTGTSVRGFRVALFVVAALATGALAVRGWPRIDVGLHYADFLSAQQRLQHVARTDGSPTYVANRPYQEAAPILGGPLSPFFPGWAAMHCIVADQIAGSPRALFFVESNPAILAAARGGRCSALFVAQAPATGAVATIP